MIQENQDGEILLRLMAGVCVCVCVCGGGGGSPSKALYICEIGIIHPTMDKIIWIIVFKIYNLCNL